MIKDKLVLIKGAGDFASGVIRRLHLAGAKIVCTELSRPLTIRRMASFSEAMFKGKHCVDGIEAVHALPDQIDHLLDEGIIPVLDDPESRILLQRKFDIVIDARSEKKNRGTSIRDAPIVVALGPGFEAGKDCDAVVETLAGHNLGRVYYSGKAAEDTGTPLPPEMYIPSQENNLQAPCCAGFVPCCAGFDTNTLVLRAPVDGVFSGSKNIGDRIKKGDVVGSVDEVEVRAEFEGIIRGLIHDGVSVTEKMKIGDIDPTGDRARISEVSEKANAIAGGVLEACLYFLNKNPNET
jgi:xanthine dehydrogenase accessory factor